MTIYKISKEQIQKTVRISNSIEGYKTTPNTVKNQVKTIMEKYNVKVSSKR
jgi:hypothetical protein